VQPAMPARMASAASAAFGASNAGGPSRTPPLFSAESLGGDGTPLQFQEQQFAADPGEMALRVELALSRMKAGQSLAQGRELIDGRPGDQRFDSAISETHAWAVPAHAMLFAAELEAARLYYERVASIGTGSESDLHARVRLRLLAADIPGALKATRARLDRYEGDFARRDLAGFEFMSGHADRAWDVLRPRLPQSPEIELWIGAQVGHRIEGLTARRARDWIVQSSYGHARANRVDIGEAYLHRYITDDRVPTDDDIALATELGGRYFTFGTLMEASVKLKRLAFTEPIDEGSLRPVREVLARCDWPSRATLKPLYAWVAWHASGGTDPALAVLRGASVAGDFDSLLAKGLLLGLEGDPKSAMTYLRAARIELAGLRSNRLHEELRSPPYTAALVSYLLFSKTKEPVYREEALRIAHAYERIFPFLAWPHALDALLSQDGPARTTAACRARYLDKDSLFLKLSGLRPDTGSVGCRKALW